jgi:hypothetical protein
MAEGTPCQTDGAVYGIAISDDTVMCHVELPFRLSLTDSQVELLRTNLHNAMELVLARYWSGVGEEGNRGMTHRLGEQG